MDSGSARLLLPPRAEWNSPSEAPSLLALSSEREATLLGRGRVTLSEPGPQRTLGASKQRAKSKGRDSGGMENVFTCFVKIHSHK